MTLSPVNRFVSVGVCILGMFSLGQVGCSLFVPKKDRTQFYVLRAAKAEGRRYSAPRTDAVDVRVGPGNVASYLDSLSIALEETPNRLKFLDSYHWAEPLAKGIARVLGENLSRFLGLSHISYYPDPILGGSGIEVLYRINRFEGALDSPVTLDVSWQVIESPASDVRTSKRSVYVIPPTQAPGTVDSYVERLSAALEHWSAEVAGAIRAP
jgi:uncharacterized lipoprotein YmbA